MGELGLLGELCYFSPARGRSMKGEMGGEGTLGRDFSWSLDFILRAASVVTGLLECGQRGEACHQSSAGSLEGRMQRGAAERRRRHLSRQQGSRTKREPGSAVGQVVGSLFSLAGWAWPERSMAGRAAFLLPLAGFHEPSHSSLWFLLQLPLIKIRLLSGEVVGWHHHLSAYEFEQTAGAGEGQGSLGCCSRESGTTEWPNNSLWDYGDLSLSMRYSCFNLYFQFSYRYVKMCTVNSFSVYVITKTPPRPPVRESLCPEFREVSWGLHPAASGTQPWASWLLCRGRALPSAITSPRTRLVYSLKFPRLPDGTGTALITEFLQGVEAWWRSSWFIRQSGNNSVCCMLVNVPVSPSCVRWSATKRL